MPPRKLVLIILDGLTPGMLELAIDSRRAPALAFLADNGRYTRAVSTFPSLTPVCLSSIVTAAHPAVHRIPPLAVRTAAAGPIHGPPTSVGRWRAPREGSDFLAFYPSDCDCHSHVLGPDGAMDVLARCDASIRSLMDAAGGPDEFLERYAVVL